MKTSCGGVVLCGGRSSRMGQPKAWLPFAQWTMLQQVVATLSEVVQPIVVVAAPDQSVPPLPAGVDIVRDDQEGLGPLAGIAAGLSALSGRVDAAYVSSCDAPLLKSSFVVAVIDQLGEDELAIPREAGYHHPLAAVYRTTLASRCCELLASGQRRPLSLVKASKSNAFEVEELTSVDPTLESLRNVNTPEEYAVILQLAGLTNDRTE